MNRRDFVKALAGVPLLGLLVKVLKVAEPTLAETYIKDVVNAESQPITLIIGDSRRASGRSEGHYWYVGDKEPYLPTVAGFTDADTYGIFVKKTGRGNSI